MELSLCQWPSEHPHHRPDRCRQDLSCLRPDQCPCRQGYTAPHQRLPRLLEELAIAHADGRYLKLLAALAKVEDLTLDDWGLAILNGERRRDLLELLDERYQTPPTLVTSQLPVNHWFDALGDPTLADAILDRLVHHAHPPTSPGNPCANSNPS